MTLQLVLNPISLPWCTPISKLVNPLPMMESINCIINSKERDNLTHLELNKNKTDDNDKSRAGTRTGFGCNKRRTDAFELTWDNPVLYPEYNTILHLNSARHYGSSILLQSDELATVIESHLRPCLERDEDSPDSIHEHKEILSHLSEVRLSFRENVYSHKLVSITRRSLDPKPIPEMNGPQQLLPINYENELLLKNGSVLFIIDRIASGRVT